jgi:uncharacterized SAM-binding protein YcdF (DUF218 family)
VFFLFSKILSFLIDPFFWIIVFLLASLFYNRNYLRRRFFTLGILFLILFSNPFIYKFTNDLWTVKYKTKNIVYDYGILLGGIIDLESTSDNILFSKYNDRLLNTIELFSKKRIKKILISGASGSLTSELKEAEILRNYLIKIGIPDSCVLAENSSNNTYENAIYSEKVLTQIHTKKELNCLIITSDYHLRRSLACFKKTNLHADPYVKKPTIKHFDLENIIVPQSFALFSWKILLHEIVGYYIYKLLNYI